MFVKYSSNGSCVSIDVGMKYAGKFVSAGDNHLPVTTINRDGYAEIAFNIFRRFREELYVDEEKLVFEKSL